MPSAGDIQRLVRNAMVQGDDAPLAGLLVGGRDWRKRLAIHRRHYDTSLITTLLGRFPATVWLIGSAGVTDAARAFVREQPPSRPCLAEYGDGFPAFLAASPAGSAVPYLGAFAELEWHVGRLSVCITQPALGPAAFAALEPDALPDVRVALQPDVHFFHADWSIDDLMRLYLTDSAPASFRLDARDVWLEVRGARGRLQMDRVDRATYGFRAALAGGRTLGDAAAAALALDGSFDPGQGLAALVAGGLIARIQPRG